MLCLALTFSQRITTTPARPYRLLELVLPHPCKTLRHCYASSGVMASHDKIRASHERPSRRGSGLPPLITHHPSLITDHLSLATALLIYGSAIKAPPKQ